MRCNGTASLSFQAFFYQRPAYGGPTDCNQKDFIPRREPQSCSQFLTIGICSRVKGKNISGAFEMIFCPGPHVWQPLSERDIRHVLEVSDKNREITRFGMYFPHFHPGAVEIMNVGLHCFIIIDV